MAVSKDLRKWNYNALRQAGYPVKFARAKRNLSIARIYDLIGSERQRKHNMGSKPPAYPKVPDKVIAPRLKSQLKSAKSRYFNDLGMSKKAAGKFHALSYENFFLQKARMNGFKDMMKSRGLDYVKAIKEMTKNLGETYSLADFFKQFRIWYENSIGVRA